MTKMSCRKCGEVFELGSGAMMKCPSCGADGNEIIIIPIQPERVVEEEEAEAVEPRIKRKKGKK